MDDSIVEESDKHADRRFDGSYKDNILGVYVFKFVPVFASEWNEMDCSAFQKSEKYMERQLNGCCTEAAFSYLHKEIIMSSNGGTFLSNL